MVDRISDPEHLWAQLSEVQSQAGELATRIQSISALEGRWSATLESAETIRAGLAEKLTQLEGESEKALSLNRAAGEFAEANKAEFDRRAGELQEALTSFTVEAQEALRRDGDENARRLEASEDFLKGRIADFQETLGVLRSKLDDQAEASKDLSTQLQEVRAASEEFQEHAEAALEATRKEIVARSSRLTRLVWFAVALAVAALATAMVALLS